LLYGALFCAVCFIHVPGFSEEFLSKAAESLEHCLLDGIRLKGPAVSCIKCQPLLNLPPVALM
jgi:hypothetical protein